MSEQDDFAEELRGDDGEQMNAKGGFGQAILAGVIVAAATLVINQATDSSDERALATLTERVSNLSEQVRKLSEQPYATRADLTGIENRVSGLSQRVDQLEQRTNRTR